MTGIRSARRPASARRERPASMVRTTSRTEGTILVVDSSSRIGGELVEHLCVDGYDALHALTAEHARSLARSHLFRAVVLGDLAARRASLDLLGEIRSCTHSDCPWDADVPVIVLGACNAETELLRAFEEGADDFIARPVRYLEMRARLESVLRRAERLASARLLRVGNVSIETAVHSVLVAGEPVELRRLEYGMLVALARRPTNVFSKQELLRDVWGYSRAAGSTRTVDSHASRLRRKLATAGAPGLVVNVWGVGYRLT